MSKIQEIIQDEFFQVLLSLLVICFFTFYALKPVMMGDSYLYTESIDVLSGASQSRDFMPMMILTTYLGLRLIMFFDLFINNIFVSWLFLDSILYITNGLFFYFLLKKMFSDRVVVILGTAFMAFNYSILVFGLGPMMDMGGWCAYMVSLYFSYLYLNSQNKTKLVYFSALAIGLGGLYKEYAFVAYLVTFGVILWQNWQNWKELFKLVIISGIISFTPFFLMNVYTYFYYGHYTYLNWFLYQKVYAYQNKIVEFIKSFGSVYNFGWFLFVPGFYIYLKDYRKILSNKRSYFIFLAILSCFSVLLWPVVTRILFVTIPTIVFVTCLFIEKLKNKMYVVIPFLLAYILCAYLMDAYILKLTNIDPVLKLFHLI